MFITKMSLPRRTFLRGMGVTVALPLLEAMIPALTAVARTAASPVRRAGFIYVPHGAVMSEWTPTTVDAAFELRPILKPLEPFRDSLTIVSGLARPIESYNHAGAVSAWLSGVPAKKTEAEDVRLGPTIDQILARHIGGDTPFRSLEVATEDFTGNVGGCDGGFSCAYMNTMSWSSPTTPLPMEINPRNVFKRMFGKPGTRAQRLARIQNDRSILDSVKADVNDLERNLGAPDRNRLGEYLDHVREIEQRIQRSEADFATQVTSHDAPLGIPESFGEHAALMFDLLTVAYEADITRVLAFMMSREASQRVYPELGITEPHHALSHHGYKPDKLVTLAKLQTYYAQLVGQFLHRLQSIPDGDGSLLDHSKIFFGSGMSDSNVHSGEGLPFVVVGGPKDRSRHIQLSGRTPLANVWVTVAEMYDVPLESFGVSTGRVEL
jgi:Protein of unknown function (DUF1552)